MGHLIKFTLAAFVALALTHSASATASASQKPASNPLAYSSPAEAPFILHCKPARNAEELTLCLSLRQAQNDEKSNNLAEKGILLTAFGTVAVAISLILSAWASKIASNAAISSEQSAKNSRDSLDLSKEQLILSQKTADHQLRAYVAVESCQINPQPNFPKDNYIISLQYRNCGQTPAHNVTVISYHIFDKKDIVDAINDIPDNPEGDKSRGVIGPNCTANQYITIENLNDAAREGIKNNELSLKLIGIISYYDHQNILRTTEFSYSLEVRGLGFIMAPCSTGNILK